MLETSRRTELFSAGGRQFLFESDREEMLATVVDRLRDLSAREPTVETPIVFRIEHNGPAWFSHPWGVWRDGEPCETTVTDEYIVPYIIWEVTRLVLENVDPGVSVHAGAVTHNGCGVLLVGASHAGKSTLTGSLVRRGWGFLTDELAVLDLTNGNESPSIRPFWRPIGIRRGGPLDDVIDVVSDEPEVIVPASILGDLAGRVPLAAIVFIAYVPGATGEPVAISSANALVDLAPQIPELAGARIGEVWNHLANLVVAVPTFSLEVDDLDVAERNLRNLVQDQAWRTRAPSATASEVPS
jgi:hypothetical protein